MDIPPSGMIDHLGPNLYQPFFYLNYDLVMLEQPEHQVLPVIISSGEKAL